MKKYSNGGEIIIKKIKSLKYILPIIAVYIAILSIYYRLYSNTVDIIKSEFDATSQLIEQSIYNETKYTEVMSQIVEKEITKKMEQNSMRLIDKYNENPDVLNWDLDSLKKQFEGMDIFIINDRLEVIDATLKEDIGLTFREHEDFSKTLMKRLNGTEFKADKINFSIRKKELTKYSYIPTPDNKYLIELGSKISNNYPEIENLNILNLSESLKQRYPFVEDIRVYEYNRDKANTRKLETSRKINTVDESIQDRKQEDNYVKKALETNEIQEQIIKDKDNNSYTFKYIPYIVSREFQELQWWGSYVIEVLYNDQIMTEKISNQKQLLVKSIVVMSLFYFIFIFLIVYLLEKNRKVAYQDHLTKLANRKKFEEVLESKMRDADKRKNKLAVLFFDLDKFKKINDTLGHNIGDKVLQEIAKKIKGAIPKCDIASRLGGDEFIASVSNFNSVAEVEEFAIKMSKVFDAPLQIESHEIPMRASIGISIYPDDACTSEQLIVKADDAMYISKQNKKKYAIYSKQVDEN